jgi:MFS family permease
MHTRRFVSISALGLITIAGYGTWFYAFGVLLDPILIDTGWAESTLTAGFGAGLAAGGILSMPAGRALDRFGSRPMFMAAATLSLAGLWLGSLAPSSLGFATATGVASAVLASLTFYHVTQPTAVRVAPDEPAKAIAILTVYGAVASTIYLPVAALLVDRVGWRSALRTMAVVSTLVLVVGAAVVKEEQRAERGSGGPGLRTALADAYIRRFVIAWTTMGFAVGIILVYQVPLMTDAGLPLATAAALAGARGAAQMTGRIPLNPIVRRLGSRRSLRLAYACIIVGVGLLAISSSVLVGAIYALVAGFGIGAASPLLGIHADEIFDRNRLGMFMGFLGAVGAMATAAGPALAGAIADATGERRWAAALALVTAVAAFLLLTPGAPGEAMTAHPRDRGEAGQQRPG